MLNIVLFGPPGAGKGTQSELILKKYSLIHISTGDLFRKHLKEGTDLGRKAQSFMDAGNLVPDEVVIGMVKDKLEETPQANGFIFDGFPRTNAQATALDKLMTDYGHPISGMVSLEVPDEELRKRLTLRAETSGRVDDQDPEKINNRIKVYYEETKPVIDHYQAQGKYVPVHGVGTIEDIFKAIGEAVDNF